MHAPGGTVRRARSAPSIRGPIAIAIVSVIAACGSSTPAIGEAFATSARAVCQHALDLKRAEGPFPIPSFNPTRPDPAKLADVAVFLRKTDATFSTWLSEMQALGTPPAGESSWNDLVTAVGRHRDLNRDQISAAERGDTVTFAADYQAGIETQAQLLAAATAAGVPDCAKVDR
ncbi:MAG TPA: hypothetical protein VEX41_10650 [Candidatus Eisenbacteria bacterium]|nr:hypothetical protein [Candidatus Eisenbacteria bacterium]